ncbi:hypothetical protein [Paraglaciecola sp.]|uniref:hypothetical protein n=1 Tax=Paraglaciecola sp. TaxID=1920173 RepID=UPI0032657CAC
MKTFELPKSISSLAETLKIVQMTWQGVTVQVPKFAVYATIDNPVFDGAVYRQGRRIALMKCGRYQIPILDPFRGDIKNSARYALIISHSRGNRFGLYGYPADDIRADLYLSASHSCALELAQNYL